MYRTHLLVVGALCGLAAIRSSYFHVDSGEVAFVFNKDEITRTVNEGFHFRNPFQERVEKYNIRSQAKTFQVQGICKDSEDVDVGIRIIIHPMKDRLEELYYKGLIWFTKEADECNELHSIIAHAEYEATELLSKRIYITKILDQRVNAEMEKQCVSSLDTSIISLNFSQEFVEKWNQKALAAGYIE